MNENETFLRKWWAGLTKAQQKEIYSGEKPDGETWFNSIGMPERWQIYDRYDKKFKTVAKAPEPREYVGIPASIPRPKPITSTAIPPVSYFPVNAPGNFAPSTMGLKSNKGAIEKELKEYAKAAEAAAPAPAETTETTTEAESTTTATETPGEFNFENFGFSKIKRAAAFYGINGSGKKREEIIAALKEATRGVPEAEIVEALNTKGKAKKSK